MRVLIVNTSERTGGAAVAANRLMDALNNNGVKAKMLVMEKQSDDICVTSATSRTVGMVDFIRERLVIWFNNLLSRRNLFAISIANAGTDITQTEDFRKADVIHLHWINQGFISLGGLKKIVNSGKPIVWTMHDMWECTGICHHAYDCTNYTTHCGNCHLLRFPSEHDLSRRVMERKLKFLPNAKIHYVAVSNWLADIAKRSPITNGRPIRVIPNSISISRFHISVKSDARSLMGLPDKKLIVFGAARIDTPIKGFNYLVEALRLLVNRPTIDTDQTMLVLYGGIKDTSVLKDIPINYKYLGYLNDEEDIARLYSAADIVVSSSLYETFGQTLIEAQACGCLPVSFDNSGQCDIITHKANGYLAKYKSAESLANGIEWGLENSQAKVQELRKNAVKRFSESVIANQYIALYNQIAHTEA